MADRTRFGGPFSERRSLPIPQPIPGLGSSPQDDPGAARVRPLRPRIWGAWVAMVAILLGLVLRLGYLQLAAGEYYRAQAVYNASSPLVLPAPRGVIYDRQGLQLVGNVARFQLEVVPGTLSEDPATRRREIVEVAQVLGTPEADLNAALKAGVFHNGNFGATALALDLNANQRQILDERSRELPGFAVRAVAERSYVDPQLVSGFLGYTGPINAEEYRNLAASGYQLNDVVGKTGLERSRENQLRGNYGSELIERDALGRQKSILALRPPVPGDSVRLTIDMAYQRAATDALNSALGSYNLNAGAVAVMDVRTGALLAMVSTPSYDLNWFAHGGISKAQYESLLTRQGNPLLNHLTDTFYPPGSTFKALEAAGALQDGLITPYTYLDCPPAISIANQYNPAIVYWFYNWANFDRGSMTVAEALAQSCDTFFYQVGRRLGPTGQARWAEAFGLGKPTGLETALAESSGLVPTPAWKQARFGEAWFDGDTLHDAIGQGFVLTTPLQMLAAYAAIANGGTVLRPQLVARVDDASGHPQEALKPMPQGQLKLSQGTLETVRQGLWQVTHGATGTATYQLGADPNQIAGKTGTAEYGPLVGGRYVYNHAWFVGYAPASAPEIAIVVLVENGGNDREHGMHLPIVKQVVDYYFAHHAELTAPVNALGAAPLTAP